MLRNRKIKSLSQSSSHLNHRNGKSYHFENVRHRIPCDNAKHLIRQPPIGKRISPLILTSILNVSVWWYSSSTPADASRVTTWYPLEQWTQFSVIPGRFSDWQSWPVQPQSSFATIIRVASRLRPRRTLKSLAISSAQASC